jgi:phage tail tape measure protein
MNAILQKILRYLILTDSGHKILKGILILIIGFILLPTIAFSPVAGFVNGVKNFFEGEGDLDDDADVSSFLGDDFSIIEMKYYKSVESARAKHIDLISEEQKSLAETVREEHKYTVTVKDANGNEHEETRYPTVDTPLPNPPMVSVLAYFCTTEEIQIADGKKKINESKVMDFYQKIAKRPFRVIERSKDHYIVMVEYMTEQDIIGLLQSEGTFKDEGDVDLFETSIERIKEFIDEAGGFKYDGEAVGQISNAEIAKQIWDYFKSLGWSDYATAGIIGNFEAECSLQPNLQEKGGTGIGLGQWSHERRTAFLNWLSENGRDISDITAQLDYLIVENCWHGGTLTLYKSGGLKHTSKVKSLSEFSTYQYSSVQEATEDFLWHWEGPNYQKAQVGRRIGAANQVYNLFSAGAVAKIPEVAKKGKDPKLYFAYGIIPTNSFTAEKHMQSISFRNSKGVMKTVRVNASVAQDVLTALQEISEAGYEIKQIGGYSFRLKVGSNGLSSHSYGLAIDINWDYGNPFIKKGKIQAGTRYLSHELSMTEGSIPVRIMEAHGWVWGGHWTNSKDYMHFSITGD